MKRTQQQDPITWHLDRAARHPGGTIWRAGRITAVVSRDDGHWHVSVSHPSRYPTWDELASAKEKFCPDDVEMVMYFPRRAEYVNHHQTTLHLWQAPDGD